MKNVSVYILTTVCAVTLMFSIASCGGGDSHPLKGTWLGYWYVFDEITVTFDNQGNISEFLRDGSPLTGFTGGRAESLGQGTYLLAIQVDEDLANGWFLMDSIERHALFVLDVEGTYLPAALEKGGENMPVYGLSDILGTWSGYSWAYSDTVMDMAEEAPRSLVATASLPDNNYTLTMPWGWILSGNFDTVFTQVAFYGGSGTGDWEIRSTMSADKQFIGVVAEGGEFDDPAFFALTREP